MRTQRRGDTAPTPRPDSIQRVTEPPVVGVTSRVFAWLVVHLRYLVVAGWIVAAVAASMFLPGFNKVEASAVGNLVPSDTPALKAEADSLRLFRFPVLSRTAIVQRAPGGLSPEAQARVVLRALALTRHTDPEFRRIAGALPVTNTLGLFPGSRERSTTAITFLFFTPDTTLHEQSARARRFAAERINQPGDSLVGVTGAAPARARQTDIVLGHLPLVEGATVALIALILALTFRSIGAPLATLFTAGIAYLIAVRTVAWAGERLAISVPADLEPLIVALLLGVVTDYCVFFLSGMRVRLLAGDRKVDAARRTTGEFAPIIFTAGLLVAAGSAALLAARLGFLRAFGPGLALTVVVGLAVSITLMPALIGIFGTSLYWPRSPASASTTELHERARAMAWRERAARFATAKPVALLIAAAVAAALVIPALSLKSLRLGFELMRGLPANEEAARAQVAAERGFAPGILSPTLVLLRRPGITDDAQRLISLERLLRREPGVAGVIGPGEQAVLERLGLNDVRGVTTAANGAAARYILVLAHDPLGGRGIEDLKTLRERMPAMLRSVGLSGVRVGFAGDTALAQETIDLTLRDLGRIALAMLLIDLLLLVVFLRALVAPVYLLLSSILALAASLGVATFVFETIVGHDDLTYYVPFAAAVLLVSLGSDYNVFVVGRIWEEARRRPLRDAVAVAAPRAARAITVAAFALAGSFAVLAIVPLRQFREFAFAMVVGVLIDSFLVRSLLVPALISLFGASSGWPGRRLRTGPSPQS